MKSKTYIIQILSILNLLFLTQNSLAVITCSNPRVECIETGSTKYFENIPVTLDCWEKRFIYECKESADNNCQQLRNQNCSQIGAKCKVMFNGTCVVQDEIYNCPIKKCELKEVPSGNNIFCIDGNCASTSPIKADEKERGKALAYLSALNDTAKQVKDQNSENPIIFAGKVMECSRYALPGLTKNCCAGKSGVFSCDAEEKELLQMKEAGRAIEIGEYCRNKDPITKTCTSHHTAYCVFGSRIARIIQNDGRRNQLGIGFGYVNDDDKASNVNCRGITKDELVKMKFDQMDFSELYAELKKEAELRSPKEEQLKQKAAEYSYDDLKTRSTKKLGISESPETGIGLKAAERIRDFYGERAKK